MDKTRGLFVMIRDPTYDTKQQTHKQSSLLKLSHAWQGKQAITWCGHQSQIIRLVQEHFTADLQKDPFGRETVEESMSRGSELRIDYDAHKQLVSFESCVLLLSHEG